MRRQTAFFLLQESFDVSPWHEQEAGRSQEGKPDLGSASVMAEVSIPLRLLFRAQ